MKANIHGMLTGEAELESLSGNLHDTFERLGSCRNVTEKEGSLGMEWNYSWSISPCSLPDYSRIWTSLKQFPRSLSGTRGRGWGGAEWQPAIRADLWRGCLNLSPTPCHHGTHSWAPFFPKLCFLMQHVQDDLILLIRPGCRGRRSLVIPVTGDFLTLHLVDSFPMGAHNWDDVMIRDGKPVTCAKARSGLITYVMYSSPTGFSLWVVPWFGNETMVNKGFTFKCLQGS